MLELIFQFIFGKIGGKNHIDEGILHKGNINNLELVFKMTNLIICHNGPEVTT